MSLAERNDGAAYALTDEKQYQMALARCDVKSSSRPNLPSTHHGHCLRGSETMTEHVRDLFGLKTYFKPVDKDGRPFGSLREALMAASTEPASRDTTLVEMTACNLSQPLSDSPLSGEALRLVTVLQAAQECYSDDISVVEDRDRIDLDVDSIRRLRSYIQYVADQTDSARPGC